MIIYLRNLLLFNVYVCGLYLLPFGAGTPDGIFIFIVAKINHKSVFRVGVKGFIC